MSLHYLLFHFLYLVFRLLCLSKKFHIQFYIQFHIQLNMEFNIELHMVFHLLFSMVLHMISQTECLLLEHLHMQCLYFHLMVSISCLLIINSLFIILTIVLRIISRIVYFNIIRISVNCFGILIFVIISLIFLLIFLLIFF